ncbi:MAG: hypothetical protein Q4D42_03110 [Eubacteriales bacterium]|nr:hypothetical protein [Eubacteriales bacterium]
MEMLRKPYPFYQWDTGRVLELDEPEGLTVLRVDFAHAGDAEALSVDPDRSASPPAVAVPNILLQSGDDILVYLRTVDDQGNRTIWKDRLYVRERERPADYVYTETEVFTYTQLETRINEVASKLSEYRTAEEQDAVDEVQTARFEQALTGYRTAADQDKIDATQNTAIETAQRTADSKQPAGDYVSQNELDTAVQDAVSQIQGSTSAIVNDASGEVITLPDSADAPLKDLHVYGRTTQASTTGAQLFNANLYTTQTRNGVTAQYLPEEDCFVLDGAATNGVLLFSSIHFNLPITKGGTYSILVQYVSGTVSRPAGTEKAVAYFGASDTIDTSTNWKDVNLDNADAQGFRVCNYDYITKFWFYTTTGATFNNYKCRIMLAKGSSIPSYEPYTGGQPSPSPEYPQEIVSAGNSGSIEAHISKSNLLDVSSGALNGWNIEKITNTLRPGYMYTFSNPAESPVAAALYVDDTNLTGYIDPGTTKSFKMVAGNDLLIGGGSEGITKEMRFCVNPGDTALSYEPYTSQALPIPTPNGLPGIPVNSGGNYTDENGQQWICDEIDFGRGKYMQRVWKTTLDGSEDEGWVVSSRNGFNARVLPEVSRFRAGFCTALPQGNSIIPNSFSLGNTNFLFYAQNLTSFYDGALEDKGLSGWKNYLSEHPLEIATYLDTPIETDLSAEQIAAYKALRTYYPTTVITNDADAGQAVRYVADTKNYIDGKISALEQALVSG